MKALLHASRWLLPLVLLAACAGELNTPGEALRLLGGSLEDAYLGEPYESAFRPAGGLRPYEFELGSGALPAGLTLESGVLRGIPEELGTFTFTINVTDANLSSTFLEHRLRVVPLPDPALEVSLPLTEVRAPVTIRVSVNEARELRGLSTRLRWDPAQFTYVQGSLASATDSIALFSDNGDDWLQVDLAWLGATFTGERLLFTFQLEPLAPHRPGLHLITQFATSDAVMSRFTEAVEGARVPPLRAEPTVDTPATEPGAGTEPDATDEVDESTPPAGDEEGDL